MPKVYREVGNVHQNLPNYEQNPRKSKVRLKPGPFFSLFFALGINKGVDARGENKQCIPPRR